MSSNKRKCLVLLSCYNGDKYISDQIDSILAQSDVDVTLIIRDDGSSDGTNTIINEYKNRFEPKIEVLNAENVGIHKSFFELFSLANNYEFDYLAFSDQDDVWDKDKLICAIDTLEINKCQLYSSASRLVDDSMNELDQTTENFKKYNFYNKKERAILTPGLQGCTMVLTRDLFMFLSSSNFPDSYGHDTWIPIVSYLFFQTFYDVNSHMNYRQHSRSWTGDRKKRFSQFKKEFGFFIKGMKRYRFLASDILDRYENQLDFNTKNILNIVKKDRRNFNEIIKLFFSKSYRKYGFLENLIFKFFILFGKA